MDLTVILGKEQQSKRAFLPAAQYYLLDRAFCTVNAHTCKEKGKEIVAGASFFDLFPTKRAVREEIATYACSFPREMLLTLCGRTPVLFVGTFAAHTGLILAVVPEGEVKSTLSFPAAFHKVPAHVGVSSSAQMRYKAHSEAAFAEACRWLVSVSAPFAYPEDADRELIPTLSFCATRLSVLLKVPFFFDFSGLPALGCAGLDLQLAIGVMLAALSAARRSGAESGVQLYAAMEGAPTLYLEYTRAEIADTVPEFLPLLACAKARGAILDVVCPEAEPCRVQVRACFGIVELSAQGVRERHRFLEGKSPLGALPQAYAVPLAFSELHLDLTP